MQTKLASSEALLADAKHRLWETAGADLRFLPAEQLETFHGLLLESQGQNLALTVLYVPFSLNGGTGREAKAVGPLTFLCAPLARHIHCIPVISTRFQFFPVFTSFH